MSDTVKAALIAGILGLIGTIAAAIIGLNVGKDTEQKNIQNEFNDVMGDIVNIFGNGNEVTINDIKELIKDYQDLQTMNDSLLAQNAKYFDDLTEANNIIKELQAITSELPNINYSNLALSIEGEDIAVNKNNSMVTIDNRDYFSREIAERLISDNQKFTIKDDTLYIGKIIIEKSSLLDQVIVEKAGVSETNSMTDSYGNNHSNVLYPKNYHTYITFNLNREFSFFKFKLAVKENGYSDAIVTIKADDVIIYTSPQLIITTEPFDVIDLPLNNCSLLTIKIDSGSDAGFGKGFDCIISDPIVYN